MSAPHVARVPLDEARLERLEASVAIVVPSVLPASECASMVDAIVAARAAWNDDFGGEQHSLGRAFYTHYETGGTDAYFRDARASDAVVERVLPGIQQRMRAWLADIVCARVRPRLGWCGAGVHVFPAGGKVARVGGIRHWDLEGLADEHVAHGRRALSVVVSLQTPEVAGGLRLWAARYRGREHPTRADLAKPSLTTEYAPGDLCVFDSYRLHQIQPFRGARDRISLTIHAAETAPGVWDSWF